jgi:hypothetical protein
MMMAVMVWASARYDRGSGPVTGPLTRRIRITSNAATAAKLPRQVLAPPSPTRVRVVVQARSATLSGIGTRISTSDTKARSAGSRWSEKLGNDCGNGGGGGSGMKFEPASGGRFH